MAGFSERIFEFAFNAEFCNRNMAVLAASPRIPTQNEEKWLGYDVEFSIKKSGGAVHALALQHKVSRCVENRGSTNKHFWDAVSGPYYAFRLDVPQYNLIQELSALQIPGVDLYYCAPVFSSKHEMDTRYLSRSVEESSIWIDVSNAGPLSDTETHTIIYDVNGDHAFVFSTEPQQLKVIRPSERSPTTVRQTSRRIDLNVAERQIHEVISRFWKEERTARSRGQEEQFNFPPTPPSPLSFDEQGNAASVSALLARYVGVDVLIETENDSGT